MSIGGQVKCSPCDDARLLWQSAEDEQILNLLPGDYYFRVAIYLLKTY
jgi:hypothetical protein